jgi:membrane-associated protease RseP (regulator of RpoE activity)
MTLLGVAILSLAATTTRANDRPALGVTMSDSAGDKATAGVVITSVAVGSPAAQAGLLAGDRILSIDHQPVSNSADVIRIIGASGVNKQVTLDVTRGVRRVSLAATLRNKDQVFRAPPTTPTVTPAWKYQSGSQRPSRQYTNGWYRVGNVIINGGRWGDIGNRYSYGDLLRW